MKHCQGSIKVLKSNLCDYNDSYILVKGYIVTTGHNNLIQVVFI